MSDAEELYKEREERVRAAINLDVPDRVPVLCSADQFSAGYAGITMYEFLTDNEKMMKALVKFHLDFQPDMVYLTPVLLDPIPIVVGEPCQIRVPGKELPPDDIFQLIETETMKEEDYDYAINNGYMQLILKLLPKLRPGVSENQFFEKGMQISQYYFSNVRRLKELGIPCWYVGGMESPFGVLCMLRSYEKFCLDLYRRRDVVMRTLERFTQDIGNLAVDTAQTVNSPRVVLAVHRESSSFFNLKQFEEVGFPMIKKMVNFLVKEGYGVVMHCDGNWTRNLPYLRELPKGKCVAEFDGSTDIFKAKEIIGDHLCIDGDINELMLAFSTPAKIEAHCKKLIDVVGEGGGFILKGEPSKEAKPENVKAMINTAKTYGVYKA